MFIDPAAIGDGIGDIPKNGASLSAMDRTRPAPAPAWRSLPRTRARNCVPSGSNPIP